VYLLYIQEYVAWWIIVFPVRFQTYDYCEYHNIEPTEDIEVIYYQYSVRSTRIHFIYFPFQYHNTTGAQCHDLYKLYDKVNCKFKHSSKDIWGLLISTRLKIISYENSYTDVRILMIKMHTVVLKYWKIKNSYFCLIM